MKLPNSFRGAPIKYQSVQKHVFLQPWDDRIFPTAVVSMNGATPIHGWFFLWTIVLRWMMENGGYTCCASIPSKTHGLKRTPRRVAAVGTLDHREDLRCHQVVPSGADEKLVHWCSFPWRIHGAAIYGFSWIQSIYPLYVSIFYQHHGYPMEVCDRLGLMYCNHRERRKVNPH